MKKANINKLNQELKTEKLKYQIEAMRQQREFLNCSKSALFKFCPSIVYS